MVAATSLRYEFRSPTRVSLIIECTTWFQGFLDGKGFASDSRHSMRNASVIHLATSKPDMILRERRGCATRGLGTDTVAEGKNLLDGVASTTAVKKTSLKDYLTKTGHELDTKDDNGSGGGSCL
uniref:Uncharacterized protein n=1 Tax=Cucumis melo TaxID=3656 RepID=A0A9I9DRI2_CUCME